jgi:nicotinamide mononucleotide transporter
MMSHFELVGTIFGLLSVWLTTRASIWCWPTGIVNIVLFAIVFAEAKLYPEIITYAAFLVLSVHGWRRWARGGPRGGAAPIARASPRALAVSVVTVAAGGPALGALFAGLTDAALPYLDSTITAASLVAQTLLARKVVESWCFWIFVDVLAIGVYASRGLHLASGLYAVFLVLAIRGLVLWRRGGG